MIRQPGQESLFTSWEANKLGISLLNLFVMEKIVFFILQFFRKMIESSGADLNQVRIIVKCKMLMDNRKVVNPNNVKKEPKYSLWLQYVMYLFFGGIVSVIVVEGKSPYTSMLIAYSFLMFMLVINMISDFSTVLFDTRDNTIIIPRPVSEPTYLLARIAHITSYILGFTIAFSIIPMLVILFKFNPLAAIIFFINALLSAIFSVFITHLLYLGLMKITSGERFKDIIAYFQIGITIFMMGGYQLLFRAIGRIKNFSIDTVNWWVYLIPSSWMAGSNEAFISFHLTMFSVVSIFLSIVVPWFGLWMVVKILAPGYSEKLAIMEQGESKKVSDHNESFSLSRGLAKIVTRTQIESAVFQALWKVAGRDRKFKQTTYPMFGSIFVFVFIMAFNSRNSEINFVTTNGFLVFLYFPLFFLFVVSTSLKYSDNFKSAWIYKTMPIEKPGEIVSATLKAIILKLFLPVYFVVNGSLIYFRGFGFIGHILIGFLLCLITLVSILSISKVDLPFTADSSTKNASGNMLLAFILLPLSFGIAGIHLLFIRFNFNVIAVVVALFFVCWFVFRLFRQIGWNKIESFEA